MTKILKKRQKPTKVDAHFRYKCPNQDCGYDHWLSLKESQTKSFKIVCDECSTVFYPKCIAKIKIVYASNTKIDKTKKHISAPKKIIDDCCTALVKYGFTKKESIELVENHYARLSNPHIESIELIKEILKNLETK